MILDKDLQDLSKLTAGERAQRHYWPALVAALN